MTEYLSDPRRHTGPECSTMADVRYEIDRLDRLLVALLAERQTYIEAAGRIKGDRGTVRDPWRIEDVVSKVLQSAEKEGLNPAIAGPVWRTLIDRCICHEFEVWDQERQGGAPRKAAR